MWTQSNESHLVVRRLTINKLNYCTCNWRTRVTTNLFSILVILSQFCRIFVCDLQFLWKTRENVPWDFFAFFQFIRRKTHDYGQVFCFNHKTKLRITHQGNVSGRYWKHHAKHTREIWVTTTTTTTTKHLKCTICRLCPKPFTYCAPCLTLHTIQPFASTKKPVSVESRFKPQYDEVIAITKEILQPGLFKCMEQNIDITNQFP